MKHHLKHMLIAGGAILAVLLVLRVDLSAALPYAIALACPLGMIFMMKGMSGHGGHDHGASGDQRGTSEVPTQDATSSAPPPFTTGQVERSAATAGTGAREAGPPSGFIGSPSARSRTAALGDLQ